MENDASDPGGMGWSQESGTKAKKEEGRMSQILDMFTPDKPVELSHSEFASLTREAVKAELLANAVRADVPSFYVNAMLTGQKVTFDEAELAVEESNESLGEMANMMEKMLKAKKNREEVLLAGAQLMILLKMIREERLFEVDSNTKEDEGDEQTDGREENDRD